MYTLQFGMQMQYLQIQEKNPMISCLSIESRTRIGVVEKANFHFDASAWCVFSYGELEPRSMWAYVYKTVVWVNSLNRGRLKGKCLSEFQIPTGFRLKGIFLIFWEWKQYSRRTADLADPNPGSWVSLNRYMRMRRSADKYFYNLTFHSHSHPGHQ